jgi:hypothetical protein
MRKAQAAWCARPPARCEHEEEQMSRHQAIPGRTSGRRLGPPACVALALLVTVALLAASASAAYASAVWRIASLADTTVAPGGVIAYHVVITNVGDTPAPATPGGDANNCVAGSPPPSDHAKCFVVRAAFPPELTPLAGDAHGGTSCTVQASSITCPWSGLIGISNLGGPASRDITFTARLANGASGTVTSAFQVSGGEAANVARTVDPTLVSDAPTPFGVDQFDAQTTADAAGDPSTQAGGHPFEASTALTFNTLTSPLSTVGFLYPAESTRDVVVDLPPGFAGDTTVVDRCSADQLANGGSIVPRSLCPATSQVGTALVQLNNGGFGAVFGPLPVFNMIPPPNAPARLGFDVTGTIVTVDATLRSDDYGLRATVRNLPEFAVQGTTLTLWGTPSDPVHDSERACPGVEKPSDSGISCPSGAPRKPFLRNPTSCGAPGVGLLTSVAIDSWEHSGVFARASARSHEPPGFPAPPSDWGPEQGTDGCDQVPFDPRLAGGPPAGARAGTATGMSFDLWLTQTSDPDTIGTADLRRAVVTLPEGVHVNPASADGLQACSPEQIALSSDAAPTCPDGAKLGTVQVDTPLLAQPLAGSIYLATPFRNPFDSLVAIYLVVSGQGVTLKLPGQVQMDPDTGQITTTIDDSPQAPFTNVHLAFDGGPRSALSLPDRCGTYTTHAVLTSWSGRTVTSDSSFTLDQDANGEPCPARFAPRLEAGTESNSAGSSSSFLTRIVRSDLDQELRALTVHVPSGVTGRIASVSLCGERDAAAGTCPESSRIGDVAAGAGAGSNPFFITNGRAYLTGPYKGGPFGLAIVVPAVAGPFDLGNVVVRSSIRVDKHTAEIEIVTDTLPRILQGIPLDVRDIRVNVNRPGFFLNATSCVEKQIGAVLESTGGLSATASTRYQASDCASLKFKPRMVLTVGGRGHTSRGRTTPLSTTLTMPPRGQSNLRFVRVTLPTTINARLTVINDACTRAEFESEVAKCAHARAGTVKAVTPLLRDPLTGSVYFVKNGHPIPDLFVALRGEVDFDLIGRVSIPGGKHLATTFPAAPDVPVRSFTLRLFGDSRNGSVGAAANLCSTRGRSAKAQLDYIAQNGRVRQVEQALVVKGCARPASERRSRRR